MIPGSQYSVPSDPMGRTRDNRTGERLRQTAVVLLTLLVVSSTFVAFVAAPAAAQSTITVDDDGGADYDTIQAAVNAASAGDTIEVAPGTYEETVTIDKQLTLTGDPGSAEYGPGPDAPDLVRGESGNTGFVLTADADGTVIEGFDIAAFKYASVDLRIDSSGETLSDVTLRRNDIDGERMAIRGQDLKGDLVGLTLEGNHIEGQHGLYITDLEGSRYEDIVVTGNDFDGLTGYSIYLVETTASDTAFTGLEATDNRMEGVGSKGTSAVRLVVEGDGNTVSDLLVEGNTIEYTGSSGLFVRLDGNGNELTGITIRDNEIRSRYHSVTVGSYGQAGRTNDIEISDNDLESSDDDGIYVYAYADYSGKDITNVVISGNRIAAGSRGVHTTLSTYRSPSSEIGDVSVTDNVVTEAGVYGIAVQMNPHSGTLRSLSISGNEVQSAGNTGIALYAYGGGGGTADGITVTDNLLTGRYQGLTSYIYGGFADVRGVAITNNEITATGSRGIYWYHHIAQTGTISFRVAENVVTGSDESGIDLHTTSRRGVDATIERNEFRDNRGPGIRFYERFPVSGVTVRQNNLVDNALGIENRNLTGVVDARENWWGDASGPSSTGPLEDPVTGTLADGTGDSVSVGDVSRVANVRFDPVLEEAVDITGLEPSLPPRSGRARFDIDSSLNRTKVEVGEPIHMTTTITNTGGRVGSTPYILTADGKVVNQTTSNVRLEPGESVTFEETLRFDDAGGYYIQVRHGIVGRVKVTGLRETNVTVAFEERPFPTVLLTLRDARANGTHTVNVPAFPVGRQTGVIFDNVTITTNRTVRQAELRLQQREFQPGGVPGTPDSVRPFMSWLTVDVNSTRADGLANTTFRFRIHEQNLDGLPPENLAVYRYSGNGTVDWVALNTTYAGQSGDYYRYMAESPGFSTFAVGVHEARFEVTAATLERDTIEVGERAAVTARVENTGSANGTYTARLRVDDEVVASNDISIPADEERAVTLRWTPDAAGEYDLRVGSRSAGTLTVEAPETPTPTETPTATPTETPTETATEASEPTDSPTDGEDGTATTETGGQPGFALVTALLALLATALLAARRRD